jgi:hypothetical protein
LIWIKLKPCKTFTQTIFPSLWSHQNNQMLSPSATVFLVIPLFLHCFFKPMVPWWLIAPRSTPPSFHCRPPYIHRNDGCIIRYSIGSVSARDLIKPWKLQRFTSDTACASLGTRVICHSVNPPRLWTWFPCCFLQICMWTVICLSCMLLEMGVLWI